MELRHYFLARHWVQTGHEVQVIAASYSHLRAVNPDAARGTVSEHEDGIAFHYLKTRSYSGNGMGRVLNMLEFSIGLRSALAGLERPDVVIVSLPHPFAVPVVQELAGRRDLPLVVEIRDLWPLSLVELMGLPRYHPLVLLMQCLERRTYLKNDLLVSLLPNGREYFARFGLDPARVVHIPNGIDPSVWSEAPPGDVNPTLQRLAAIRRDSPFLVMYFGTIGKGNDVASFIQASRSAHAAGAAFVVVGSGVDRQALESEANGHVHFLNPVARHLVPAVLGCADVLYIGWNDCPALYRYGISPIKMADYMMAAKPIVHSVRAWNDPVAESGCGISVPPGQPGAIAGAVDDLLRLSGLQRAALGRKGREYALREYDYRLLAARYLGALDQVVARQARGTADG